VSKKQDAAGVKAGHGLGTISDALKESGMNPEEHEPIMRDSAADAMLNQAWIAQCAGKLDEAELQYHEILRLNPRHPAATHFLGILCHQKGHTESGILWVRKSIELLAGRDDWQNNLGNMLATLKRDDEAAQAFLASLEINPSNPIVWNNLGAVLQRGGRLEEATLSFENAIALDPDFEDAFNNLGNVQTLRGQSVNAARSYCNAYVLHPHPTKPKQMLGVAYYILGKIDEAAQIYRQWLQEEPGNPIAHHLLAGCTGQNVPERASNAYLEAHFDHAAAEFDNKLVATLGYKIPELTGLALKELGIAAASLSILDAGCGTGLCGPFLAPYASYLRGIDLSGKSLALAAQKNTYHDLVKEEIVSHLNHCDRSFDLIVAADTFIYFGDLQAFLSAAAGALNPDGLLIASAEELHGARAHFSLNPNGRYSHSQDYLEASLTAAGFELCAMAPVEVRIELGESVSGWILVARKPR
jgi:predicted TPR repeat methyltransferase